MDSSSGGISGMIDMLVSAVIRPPRASYPQSALGPERTVINGRAIQRTDVTLHNGKGMALQCSHYQPHSSWRPMARLPCMVYLHGNASCRLEGFQEVGPLILASGITLFTFDFSGSGNSDGEFISLGYNEKEDVKVVMQYLMQSGTVSRIGIWGFSMGAATALLFGAEECPEKEHIKCMVLDSPFSSLPSLVGEIAGKLPVPSMMASMGVKMLRKSVKDKSGFDINDVKPIEFIHGRDDDFVPSHHSEELCKAYKGPEKRIILCSGDHNARPRPPNTQTIAWVFIQNMLLAQSDTGIAPISLSEVFKIRGNERVGQGAWQEALECYDEAIRSELAVNQARTAPKKDPTLKKERSLLSGLFGGSQKSASNVTPEEIVNPSLQGGTLINVDLLRALHSNRSLCYLKLGRLEDALKDAESTVSFDPKWPRGYQRKALALMALGRKEEAMEAAREGLKFDSSFAPLMEILQNK